MIDQVRASLSNLSKSERAVAETILADPEHSVHLSIARLAVAAGYRTHRKSFLPVTRLSWVS